jgi:putative N-acetylmannosamine-6-phosphate epimerase
VAGDLTEEFAGVHLPALVARCVAAARHSVQDVTGTATPEQVERIARKHLEILAIVAAERRRPITFGNTP